MTRRRNEVEATVDAIVADVASIEARFVLQILLELVVDVSDDGLEASVIVDGIAVAGSVDDSQAETNTALFNFNLEDEKST